MKVLHVLFSVLMLTALFLCPISTRADSMPVYLVQASMTFTGTNACTPAPCTQEVDFSFEWSYTKSVDNEGVASFSGQLVPNASTFSTSGSLGSASGSGEASMAQGYWFLGALPGVTTFDFYVLTGNIESAPLPPTIGAIDMYYCGIQLCVDDFLGTGYTAPVVTYISRTYPVYTVTEVTPQAVPEPSTPVLLLWACLLLLAAKRWLFLSHRICN